MAKWENILEKGKAYKLGNFNNSDYIVGIFDSYDEKANVFIFKWYNWFGSTKEIYIYPIYVDPEKLEIVIHSLFYEKEFYNMTDRNKYKVIDLMECKFDYAN